MNNMLKRLFALTDDGVKITKKAMYACFIANLVNIAPVMIIMLIMNDILEQTYKSNYIYVTICIIILIALYFALSFEYVSLYNATYKESENLRINLANKISKLPLSYFSKNDLSDIAQTIMKDVATIEHALSHAVPQLLGFLLFLPIMFIMLLLGNVKLALCVIIPVVLGLILSFLSKNVQEKATTRYYIRLRENADKFQETIENQQEIKSFGLADKFQKILYERLANSEKLKIKVEMEQAIPVTLSVIFMKFSVAIVIFFGTRMYINNEISILYLIGYILVAIKIKDLAEAVVMFTAELFYISSSVKRINEITNYETQQNKDKDIDITNYDIEFKNVTFGYEDNQVLKGVSFTAKQNEVTALVGASGCGKTTILKLISRLYDYDGGLIKIGGVDIKDINTEKLFEKISIVFQDVTLFNSSILENIRIGKADATDEEVKNAARLANCEEFIEKLEKGYDTLIGENGATLSGGERQRLSIARAFLKNAPIIILDEISASLDVENETKIQDSLNKLIPNKTVVVISHRLKSIENVNKIVVLEDGKVEYEGSHKEALEKSKTYNNLFTKSKLAEEFVY